MSRYIIIFFFILFLNFFSEAQDIHFTQYYTSPANLNPALTGFFSGNQRFTLQNKTQWHSVTTPFKTLSASFDMPVLKRYLKQDLFGGGVVINRDQAGDSKFGTTQINFAFSYIRSLNKINNRFISVGVQAGLAQRTIDYSKLVFDNQYDGTGFNPAIPNNEQFSKENFIFGDISAGVFYNYLKRQNLRYSGGFALYHINKPKQSLFDNKNVRLDRKLVLHANSQFDASKKIQVLPGILFMRQGTYNEVDIGAIGKFIKFPEEENYLALSFGIYYRVNDAFNFIAGLDYKDISAGISYDINSSNLVPASNSKGGLELSLIYIINKNKKTYVKKVPCPIF